MWPTEICFDARPSPASSKRTAAASTSRVWSHCGWECCENTVLTCGGFDYGPKSKALLPQNDNFEMKNVELHELPATFTSRRIFPSCGTSGCVSRTLSTSPSSKRKPRIFTSAALRIFYRRDLLICCKHCGIPWYFHGIPGMWPMAKCHEISTDHRRSTW